MSEHIENRDRVLEFLKEELVGPSQHGDSIDCSGTIFFESDKDFYRSWKQMNGEEILQRDPPMLRYGIGVLYPLGDIAKNDSEEENINLEENDEKLNNTDEDLTTDSFTKDIEKIQNSLDNSQTDSSEAESDDFNISSANDYNPSSMGISFLAEFPKQSRLIVKISGGYYRQKKVYLPKKDEQEENSPSQENSRERIWWLRKPLTLTLEFDGNSICQNQETVISEKQELDGLKFSVEVFSRPSPNQKERERLVTVCLVNRTNDKNSLNRHEKNLFQTTFDVTIASSREERNILPYPSIEYTKDPEKQSLDLLYHHMKTYGVGHGCAADWDQQDGDRVKKVIAECLPTFETPSTTPDIGLEVSMKNLAGLVEEDDGFSTLQEIIDSYENWIQDKREDIHTLDDKHHQAAHDHLDQCERAVERMKSGLNYLNENSTAKKAFQLANHAIFLQQISSRSPNRTISYNNRERRWEFSQPYQTPDKREVPPGKGKWRAFQIAFLLMSLQSTAEGNIPDRETVELIWFPTGGGKTEAYLGLSAFALFLRRLSNKDDAGVQVLMRYTLRLLTAQQFQRASALLCSMEFLRRKNPDELGKHAFSIGIWLGSATTPNTQKDAQIRLKQLNKSKSAENPFIIDKCPWCNAQIGRHNQRVPRGVPSVVGYQPSGGSVIFHCSDSNCEFFDRLPIYVIDEDIYKERPSLIIGTVDKFAQLAWKPEARSIFGINEEGERDSSPPGLIIQDELHLISGPLGSVVGLYETLIEELCTDRRGETAIKPKIVCSTATIRRYAEQVKALYGREDVVLFPPPGLDVSDSFFARYARDQDGNLQPGRRYVGVHGLGSLLTAQVRTSAALLQAPKSLDLTPNEQDPWWTLLMFFNNLRELGYTLSLLQSDIPGYLKVLRNRFNLEWQNLRRLWQILELTGRIRSDKVPEAISNLEVRCDNQDNNQYPVDVCLASNIIEVGIDIDRLSLMTVVGQPKTTSQYIQVTGRVGRSWWERPGLVVTIYSPTRSRDRSHFEKFRSYHERLYAQVEPTSLTPFSPPVLERALHAIMVGYVRQVGNQDMAGSPDPYPEEFIERLREILLPRIRAVNPDEEENFEHVFERRAAEWKNWQRTLWRKSNRNDNEIPLLRQAGDYASREEQHLSWATPTSMRNVDAECQAEITTLYLDNGDEENA